MKDPLDPTDINESPRRFEGLDTVGKLREKLESLVAEGRITDDTSWYIEDGIILHSPLPKKSIALFYY